MGLDITVAKCDSFARKQECQALYSKKSHELWKEVGGEKGATDIQKERIEEKLLDLQNELNVDEWGTYVNDEPVEFSYTPHPGHIFQMGYFRSSYNSSGYNSVAIARGIPSLYDVFGHNDGALFQPDWDRALAVTQEAVDMWRELEESPKAFLNVIKQCVQRSEEITEASAIETTLKNTVVSLGGNWSNRDGVFSDMGEEFVGLVQGTTKNWDGKQVPTVFVVLKCKENQITWYRQAAEILLATITEIVNHPEKEGFYLHWSG